MESYYVFYAHNNNNVGGCRWCARRIIIIFGVEIVLRGWLIVDNKNTMTRNEFGVATLVSRVNRRINVRPRFIIILSAIVYKQYHIIIIYCARSQNIVN